RVCRVSEAGKGLAAAREYLGIAGLDFLLRFGVDLTVVQRRCPIRRSLEHGEMSDLAGNGLDRLDARGAGADHGDALAGEIHRLLWPAGGVEGFALETVTPLDARQCRRRERADRGDQEAGAVAAAVLQRNRPAPRVLVVMGGRNPALELDV